MFVNSTNLENASLEDAVQALKGADIGKVRIGVAKPLPVRKNIMISSSRRDFCVCVYCIGLQCVCVCAGVCV